MKNLTQPNSPTQGFSTGPGSQMGAKSKAILELLRKGKPRNRLDIEMLLGYPVGPTLSRLTGLSCIRKCTHGSATGCYEITGNGRVALGESLSSKPPEYAPIINATMTTPYIPAVHSVSRIGLARA